MTAYQERRLFDAIWDAFNPPTALHAGRRCALCGWPCHPAFRGRNKAHQHGRYGTLCGRCHAVPEDTAEAAAALANLRGAR